MCVRLDVEVVLVLGVGVGGMRVWGGESQRLPGGARERQRRRPGHHHLQQADKVMSQCF